MMAVDPICEKADLQKARFAKKKRIRRLQWTEALPRGKLIEAGFSCNKVKV